MTLLAGFLDVLLRGLGLIALSAAVGGVAYALVVLRAVSTRPAVGRETVAREALGRVGGLVALGALLLALSRAVVLFVLHPWVLADADGHWPVVDFVATEFGRASLVGIALALALAVVAARLRRPPTARVAWMAAAAIGIDHNGVSLRELLGGRPFAVQVELHFQWQAAFAQALRQQLRACIVLMLGGAVRGLAGDHEDLLRIGGDGVALEQADHAEDEGEDGEEMAFHGDGYNGREGGREQTRRVIPAFR